MALITLTQSDRLRRAFLAMVNAVAPNLLFLGQYEAKVVTSSAPVAVQSQLGGVTWVVSAVFTDAAVAKVLPPLANITVWPGPVWGYSQPVPGSLVRIAFVNGDPSKPAIVGFDPSVPATSVSIGSTLATPLAIALPIVTLNAAIGTWCAALNTALAAPGVSFSTLAAAMGPATTTLTAAISAANAATATIIVKGT
jgi:hypothetical protein